MSTPLQIRQKRYNNESPYVVTDIRGKTVFNAQYEHEARAFVRGVQFADSQNLWTDYPKRFQVLLMNDRFFLYDFAEEKDLGNYETEEEAHEARLDAIEEDKQQDKYFNNSGR